MTSAQSTNGKLLYRVQKLLRRKPELYDVVFCVGPAQIKVKAVRILLEAASSALEKKFEFWDSANVRVGQGKGIPIPDFEPTAFKIFVKLTMIDDWTTKALTNLKLQPGQILDLISICRVYEIESGLKHLEELMKSFYSAFAAFKNTDEFLRLSYSNLQTILSSDNLPIKEIDVFECACRWAQSECEKRKIEGNAENLRLVLGDALFEIRFPLMTPQEFTQCVDTHNILTPEESFEVYRFITSNKTRRECRIVSRFPFKTKSRVGPVQLTVESKVKTKPPTLIPKAATNNAQAKLIKESKSEFLTLCLKMDSLIVDNPPFVCDGKQRYNTIETKRKIRVHGLSFLGPIDADAGYDVTVKVVQVEDDVLDFLGEYIALVTMEKRISAKKGTTFRIMFDQPVMLTEGFLESGTNYYRIYYSLKGPNTKSFQRKFGFENKCTKLDRENEFELKWWSNQLAEILYTNV